MNEFPLIWHATIGDELIVAQNTSGHHFPILETVRVISIKPVHNHFKYRCQCGDVIDMVDEGDLSPILFGHSVKTEV